MRTNRKKTLVLMCAVLVLCLSATTRAIPLKVDFDRDNGTSPTGWEYFKGVEIWQQGNQNVTKTFTDGTTLNIVNTSGAGQLAVEHDWTGTWNPSGDLEAMARDGLIFCVDGGAAMPGSITMSFTGLLPNQHYTLTSYHCQTQDAGYGGAAEPTTLTVGGVVAGTVTPTQPNPADASTIPQLFATFTTDGSGAYSDIVFTAPADGSSSEKKMTIFVSGIELTESSGPDEPAFRFTVSQSEAKEDVSPALFDVQLLNPAEGQTYSVNYAVSGGTADSNDYTLTTPTLLTFDPCETVKTISINIINDGAEEADETIILQLSNPSNGAILAEPNSHTYTIINPPPPGWLAVDFEHPDSGSPTDWTAVTNASGDTFNGVTFTITNETGFGSLSISYDTGWGGGYNPTGDLGDMVQDMLYVHDAGGVTIQMVLSGLDPYRPYFITTWHNSGYPSLSAPEMIDIFVGETEVVSDLQQSHGVSNSDDAATATFGFTADINGEVTITFVSNSGSPGGADGWHPDNVCINGFELMSDAAQPVIGFELADSNGLEDENPTALIDVELHYPAEGQTYTVDYVVIGGTADGNDYNLTTPTPLVFTPGEFVKTISIDIIDDGLDEGHETIILQLSNPSNGALLLASEHTYTINDPRPRTIWDPESVLKVDLECGKSDPSNLGSPPGWSVLYGPDGYSTTFGDINVSFTNETGNGSIGISYNSYDGDYVPSGDLAALVQDHMYIHDSEGGSRVKIRMDIEGLDADRPYLMHSWHNSGYNNGAAPGMIDILVGGTEVVSDFQQSHGVGNSDSAAIAEFGFTADANGMVTIYFVANNTSSGGPWTADNVAINGFELLTDTSEAIFEFDVTESGGFEDETPPGIDVKLSYPPYEQAYTIDYEVIGGTAESNDYTLAAGTLVFDPCETIESIIFDNIVDDGVDEDDETVILQLYNPSLGALLVNAEHTYTIIDIRPKASFAIAESNGVENVTPVLIEVNLNRDDYIKGTPRDTITVDYAATGGTADEDRYILPPGTLTFPAGVTSQYINMEVVDDIQKIQPDETVVITLSNPTGPSTLGSITEYTYTFIEDDEGVLWEGKRWYWTNENADDFKRCFINEDGDLEWWPQQKGHIVCRIPDQVLSQGPAVMEYMLMTDGPHDCGGCDCDCFEESIQCVAGTSDFRVVLAEADGEYIDYDQYSVGNDIFVGYKGVQFRFGPNMNASPTRWVDCTGETHKTGTINRKPESSENLAHGNDDPELRVLPGFETPPGEYSYFRVSIDSSGDAEITLNGRTYGAGGGPSMGKVDVFAIYMRNGRPYTRFVLRSLKECPGDFTGDFNVNEKDLEKLSKDWLEPDSPANLYEDGIIDGKDFAEFALYWLNECK